MGLKFKNSLTAPAKTPVCVAPPGSASALPVGETLLPITEHLPDDIFVVGYPKSGNTWVQNLIAAAIHGVDLETATDSLVQQLVPDVSYKKGYKRHAAPMFFKSHALPTAAYRRVIYLLRDGRDAMVSYLHHLRALRSEPVDFLDLVQTGRWLYPCKWHEHIRQWWPNPFGAEFMLVRYEDLQRDTLKELERICEFAGRRPDAGCLKEAVGKASFAAMQNREKRLGWDNPQWPKDKAFVRRGIVGSHADEMPREVLEAFLKEAGETLRLAGYSCSQNGNGSA